jgi:hypothetical protein
MPKNEVFNSVWCNRYEGKIILFAKKMSWQMEHFML